jgi:crotonobetainyl-CoA:carnitine CoA-transferase CaiB-like acyl-CoA transferase
VKVVDLSCNVSGRFAAKLLAMAGFEVIRPVNANAPNSSGDDPLSLYLDAGKKSIVWTGGDISTLVTDADVVFTSFDRGRYLGLAAQRLPLPETSIHITTSTFGTSGPYCALRGGPLADWVAGGYAAITGEPTREPLIGPEYLCSYVGGYNAALAAEAALHERQRSGQGQHVDVSTMESMLCLHQSTFSRAAAGIIRQRTGRYAEVYPLVVRPCKNGYVSLGVVTDAEFDRLMIAIERPELLANERFRGRAGRWENRDALDQVLESFLRDHTAEEVVRLLQLHGVAATKVVDPSEVLANEQLQHRQFWVRHAGPRGGDMPGNPVPAAKVFAVPQLSHRQAKSGRIPLHRSSKQLPLSGTVVLDFTAFWAGPSATRCLADLGAHVIWVERPGSRLDVQSATSDASALVRHLYHVKMNRNKYSVVLDLESSAGRESARQLASEADVLVENFRPGVMERLGLGAAALCTMNPALVYLSLSGFGSSGPWADWRSYGPNIEAASSILARTGYPGGEPLRLGHALPDGVGGVVGALAALRGLRERNERGCGGWFDLSQLEAYSALSGEDILAASMLGESLSRIGNRSRQVPVQGIFPCRGEDQWVAIRLADQGEVVRFSALTDLQDLAKAAANEPRDDDAIEAMIGSYTRSREKQEIARVLQDAGLEVLPVLSPAELVADPHLRERGFFVRATVEGRTFMLPGSPLRGSRTLTDTSGPPPRFGQHTQLLCPSEKHLIGDDSDRYCESVR